jgi:HK97 family phage major capsid protein
LQARALTNLPEHVFPNDTAAADVLRNLHEASDNLYILDMMARMCDKGNYRGPRSLKYYAGQYLPLHDEFRKAMDTATSAEGTEWIPTGMSAELTKMVELALEVASLFPSFTMPTKTYDWPIQTGHATAYLPGEATSDAATAITASTPATSKTTFTAKKLAARILTSTEFIEDDIIPALPFIREEIALTLARAIDEVILNGDTAGTHEDSDVTAATDRRKAWLGLRAFANDNSKSSDTGAFAVADLHTIRAAMGKYGKNQRQLAFIVSATQYFAAIADTSVATVDKFGQLATYLTGELAAFEGVPIRTSEFVRENLNASGVYDGVTETKAAIYCVHKPSWKIADRRLLNLEVEKIIETDQFQLVGTLRKDFQPMHGTDSQCWIGYNVS